MLGTCLLKKRTHRGAAQTKRTHQGVAKTKTIHRGAARTKATKQKQFIESQRGQNNTSRRSADKNNQRKTIHRGAVRTKTTQRGSAQAKTTHRSAATGPSPHPPTSMKQCQADNIASLHAHVHWYTSYILWIDPSFPLYVQKRLLRAKGNLQETTTD